MLDKLVQTFRSVDNMSERSLYILGPLALVALVSFLIWSQIGPRDITPDFAACSEPLYGNGELPVSFMAQLAVEKTVPGALNARDAVKRAEEHFGTGPLGTKEYITLCPADPLVEDEPLVATVNGVNVGKSDK